MREPVDLRGLHLAQIPASPLFRQVSALHESSSAAPRSSLYQNGAGNSSTALRRIPRRNQLQTHFLAKPACALPHSLSVHSPVQPLTPPPNPAPQPAPAGSIWQS